MRVDVQPYDPDWPRAFEEIRAELTEALIGVDVQTIEHVGSTSVPGLAAKPVIDVDIVVTDETKVAPASAALEAIGYQPLGDLGVPLRYAFSAPDNGHRRNVYVTVDGCLSLRNHLGVRHVLRTNRELRDRYGRHKLALGENDYDDIDGYVADKSAVLQLILAEAGLEADERAAIAAVNSSTEV